MTFVMPWHNEVFCPHIMWSDGEYDYDFGNEGKWDSFIQNWTLHKGHVRRREIGFNEKYKQTFKMWNKRK